MAPTARRVGEVRSLGEAPVGDTITYADSRAASKPLPGYRESKPVIWCGLFPTDASAHSALRRALEKLQLTDPSLVFEPDKSAAMGTGFRCGFLGLLHAATTQERLETDFDLDLIASAPSVSYGILPEGATEWKTVSNPAAVPPGRVKIREPYARVDILAPANCVGQLMELGQGRRGDLIDHSYVGTERVRLTYELPVSELVSDLHDAIKSRSRGYATMDYRVLEELRENALVRLDILIAGDVVDGLASIVHLDAAQKRGQEIALRLKNEIPPQMFKVSIQAAIGGKVIASQHIKPVRKDVTAKCYGGDVTRKKKLLAKQAEGKKRMKAIGRVNVPQSAFMAVLTRE